MSHPAGETIGHFELVRELGAGGMGTVYEARDTRLGRRVALKFLARDLQRDARTRERFVREARAASVLDHDNIGTIYDVGETADGEFFIVMACYEGETLQQRLTEGPLPWREAVSIASQAAAGLGAAHASGIIHRDIKPSNLIVTPEGRVKILDFGVARVADEPNLTRTGAFLGTIRYMSPEQTKGQAPDPRTDIWALGVVLYEMLTGRSPFPGSYDQAVIFSILNDDPPGLEATGTSVPASLERIVEKCLQKDPDARYATTAELLDDLSAVERGGALARGPKARSRNLLRTGSLILGALAILAASVVLLPRLFEGRATAGSGDAFVAVLPLDVIGDPSGGGGIASGLVYSLTSQLSQMDLSKSGLSILPAGEITEAISPSQALEQFGVSTVVTGALQMEGERLRLTLNLVDTRERRLLKSEVIDHSARSVLALQDEAIGALARMLDLSDPADQPAAGLADRRANDEANRFYLDGLGRLKEQQSREELAVAVRQLRTAVELDSTFALAHAALGEAYWALYGRTGEIENADLAIHHTERALDLRDDQAPVYVSLAVILAGRAQEEQALRAVRRAVEIDPDNAEAYRRMGIILHRLDRTDEAEQAYRRSIELSPRYWRGYNSLAVFYYRRGMLEQAIRQYELGLRFAPMNLTLLSNLGAAYFDDANVEKAVETFGRVLEIEPDRPVVLYNLATATFYQGDYRRAAGLYARIVAETPADHGAHGYLADALYWMATDSSKSAARSHYRTALRLAQEKLTVSPSDVELLGSMATYYARLGVADSAAMYLDRRLAQQEADGGDPYRRFAVGEISLLLGRRGEAVYLVASALRDGYGLVQVRHSPWLRSIRNEPPIRAAIEAHGRGAGSN